MTWGQFFLAAYVLGVLAMLGVHIWALSRADPETRAEFKDARMIAIAVLTTLLWFITVPVTLIIRRALAKKDSVGDAP